MAKRFLTNIDLTKNEIQNVVIHKLATAPSSPVEGQIYYNTSDERYYLRQSAGWKDVTGRLDDIIAGHVSIQITDNGDGTLGIDINTATQTQKGLMSSGDKTKLDNATSNATASTIVARDANGDFSGNRITANDMTIVNAPVNPTDAVNKGYVDNLVSSGVNIKGSIDCSTNPNYPAASVGDAYYVSVAGLIGGASGTQVQSGDLIVCTVDTAGGSEALVGTSFVIMERNIDYASETVAGYIQLATQAEVDAGTDDTKAVTPLKLATVVASIISAGNYAANIGLGDGLTTSFLVAHGLNTTDVQIQLKDNNSLEIVEADMIVTDNNNVTITFNNAPTLDAYRVIIQGN